MCLDDADDDVHAIATLLMRRFQHGIGLPHAGIGAKEDFQFALQLAGFFRLHPFEQRIWIWAVIWLMEPSNPHRAARVSFSARSYARFLSHYKM